ncbi:hypothetical protein D3C81_2191310 [compost metagenome]
MICAELNRMRRLFGSFSRAVRIQATASLSLSVFHNSTPLFIKSDASLREAMIRLVPSSPIFALSKIFCTSSCTTWLSWLFLTT